LANAKDGAGDSDSAKEHWQQAKTMAQELGDTSLQFRILAALASREALSAGSPDSIRKLVDLRDEALAADGEWVGANIALDLSGIFLRMASEKEAAENAENCLAAVRGHRRYIRRGARASKLGFCAFTNSWTSGGCN